MKKNITIIALVLAFTSCITQKKVNTWLKNHPAGAAGYCADNFPPDTLTRIITKEVDSTGYLGAYLNMSHLADSLFYRLDSLTHSATPEHPYKPNIDSLRKAVDKEIKKRLKPCVDSVVYVTNTVVDKARVTQLQGLVDKKDFVIAEMQVKADEREDKISSQRKWFWLFWVLVALIGGYTFLKLRFKLPF